MVSILWIISFHNFEFFLTIPPNGQHTSIFLCRIIVVVVNSSSSGSIIAVVVVVVVVVVVTVATSFRKNNERE